MRVQSRNRKLGPCFLVGWGKGQIGVRVFGTVSKRAPSGWADWNPAIYSSSLMAGALTYCIKSNVAWSSCDPDDQEREGVQGACCPLSFPLGLYPS